MLRFKYNSVWQYVDVYCDEIKIKTINYVNTYEEAYTIAVKVYKNYCVDKADKKEIE